jgi:hypothetical protein
MPIKAANIVVLHCRFLVIASLILPRIVCRMYAAQLSARHSAPRAVLLHRAKTAFFGRYGARKFGRPP